MVENISFFLQEAGLASAGRATGTESEEEVWTVVPPRNGPDVPPTPSDPLWSLVVPPAREFPPVDKLTRRAGNAGILSDFGSLFQEVSVGGITHCWGGRRLPSLIDITLCLTLI